MDLWPVIELCALYIRGRDKIFRLGAMTFESGSQSVGAMRVGRGVDLQDINEVHGDVLGPRGSPESILCSLIY